MGDTFASKALRCSRVLKEGDQTHLSCAAAQDSEKWTRKGIECWEGDGRVVVRKVLVEADRELKRLFLLKFSYKTKFLRKKVGKVDDLGFLIYIEKFH